MTSAAYTVPDGCPDIVTLATSLWGEPTSRTAREIRFGRQGSKVVKPSPENVYHDFETNAGGGYRDLYHLRYGEYPPADTPPARPRIDRTYDYRDETGAMVFQVVRMIPKTFRQRRPDPAEPGGWSWSVKGVRRVPYRLPELWAAPSDAPVYVAEGEKDVDALRALGVVATCNCGGAGKWTDDCTRALRGRNVVILPDNDQAGRDHARDVLAKLRPVAASVSIVTLPGLPDKGDVSDWIAAGGTREQLSAIAYADADRDRDREYSADLDGPPPYDDELPYGDAIPEPPPYDDPPAPERVVSIDGTPYQAPPAAIWRHQGQWDEAAIPQRPWVVPRYLMRGTVSLLAGPPSAGKSSIMKAWTIAAAFGLPFGRFIPPHPLKVLTYNVEDDLAEEQRRMSATLRQFNRQSYEIPDTLDIIGPASIGTLIQRDSGTGYVVNSPAFDQLRAIIEETRPDVIMLDPLVELHNVEENDNTGLRSVMAAFRALAGEYQCAVLIAHHTRKGGLSPGDPEGVRGAGAIVGAVRSAFTLFPMTEEEADKLGIDPKRRRWYFRLDDAKQNYAPIEDAEWFERRVYDLENGEQVAAAEPWHPPSPWDGLSWDAIDRILERIEAGLDDGRRYGVTKHTRDRWAGNAVMEASGMTEGQAARVVRAWVDNGVLTSREYHNPVSRKSELGAYVDPQKAADMRQQGT